MAKQKVTATSVVGELLLTFGVVLLLFAVYESFWTNIESSQLQSQAEDDLDEQWKNPRERVHPELGDAFARMYIPAFGSDWNFTLLEGVDDTTLLAGPGRYPDTAMPGELGNFALAGHRVGKGAPFNDLGSLNACDAIVIETQHEWITYRVLPIGQEDAQSRRQAASHCFDTEQTEQIAVGSYAHVHGRHITTPGDVGVLAQVPSISNQAVGEESLQAVLTLTTCHPQFSNAERMIIHAMAVDSVPKGDGVPVALEETV